MGELSHKHSNLSQNSLFFVWKHIFIDKNCNIFVFTKNNFLLKKCHLACHGEKMSSSQDKND